MVSTTLVTGRKSGISSTAARLMAAATDERAHEGVQIVAGSGNAGTVYIGGSGVTADTADATDGFPLAAGDSILVKVRNPSDIYLITTSGSTDKVWFIIL